MQDCSLKHTHIPLPFQFSSRSEHPRSLSVCSKLFCMTETTEQDCCLYTYSCIHLLLLLLFCFYSLFCCCFCYRSGSGSPLPAPRFYLLSAADTPSESACRPDHASAPRQVVCLCNGAAMKLRLIEQACGCSAVRGGGGLNMAGCALARHLQTWLVFVFSTAVSKFERVNSCVEARNPPDGIF